MNNIMKIKSDIIHSKLHYKIAHHLAFIVNHSVGEGGSIGTGLFAEINNLRFVITAKHVIKGANEEQIYINFGIDQQKHIFKKLKIWADDYLDLAFIELNKFETDILRDKIEPFIFKYKGDLKDVNNLYGLAICGYPRTKWDVNGNWVNAGTFTISIQYPLKYELWPSGAKKRFNPKDFFLISLKEEHIGQKLIDQNGNPPSKLDPHGMSGSPVWLFNLNTINNDNPEYAFMGILTHYLREEPDILKATYINKIIEAIENEYGFKLKDWKSNDD